MSLRKYLSKDVVMASGDTSIADITKTMKEKNVGSVVIVKNNENDRSLLGIVTDRDILIKLIDQGSELNKKAVKEIVSQDVLTLKDSEGFKETTEKMAEKGVRRAPVVDDNNQVIGIVTLDDLLITLAEKLSVLSNILKKQSRNA